MQDAPSEGFQRYLSFQKVANLDIGLHGDVLTHERDRMIGRQSQAIRELSTPVLQVRDRLLLLPLIGVIDTHRAQLITENLLKAIRDTRAKVVVIDVTGVATIDSKVANHLMQTVTASRLMGAHDDRHRRVGRCRAVDGRAWHRDHAVQDGRRFARWTRGGRAHPRLWRAEE